MESLSHELRPTISCVRSQALQVNTLYNKVQRVLESEVSLDSPSPVDDILRATQSLKHAVRDYDAASRILTGFYSTSGQHRPLHEECVRRRDCLSDINEVLRELNSRLEELSRSRLSSLDLSLSIISTLSRNVDSVAERSVTQPRTSKLESEDDNEVPAPVQARLCKPPAVSVPTAMTSTSTVDVRVPFSVPAVEPTVTVSASHCEETEVHTSATPWWEEPGPSRWQPPPPAPTERITDVDFNRRFTQPLAQTRLKDTAPVTSSSAPVASSS